MTIGELLDWKNIVRGLAGAGCLALAGWMCTWTYKVYAEHKEVVAFVHNHTTVEAQRYEQMQQQQTILKQIAKDVSDVKLITLTVSGNAKVLTDGGDEASMLINVTGRAMMYKAMKRARVTNTASPDQPSIIVAINGTFQHTNEENIILLTRKAGALLSLEPNQIVRVRVEPVVEEKND